MASLHLRAIRDSRNAGRRINHASLTTRFTMASVMELLDELHAAGSTIVMVTHDTRFAERAERTIQLLDGRIVGATLVA
jgi:predicted ABC-type transport system involved in lysophospholipase L1 biosynthesis ATPase subunit